MAESEAERPSLYAKIWGAVKSGLDYRLQKFPFLSGTLVGVKAVFTDPDLNPIRKCLIFRI